MEKAGQDRAHCTDFCSSELFELSGSLHTLASCSPLRLVPARGTSFLCFAKERKQRKATAGTGLAPPNFPHSARFFGRARNLRLRRFGHASPCSPKNRAPFGCASREARLQQFEPNVLHLVLRMIDSGMVAGSNDQPSELGLCGTDSIRLRLFGHHPADAADVFNVFFADFFAQGVDEVVDGVAFHFFAPAVDFVFEAAA